MKLRKKYSMHAPKLKIISIIHAPTNSRDAKNTA
jgi:hypothetical protein